MLEKIKNKKLKIDTVQINLGNKCNQSCFHCHIEASPKGNKNMKMETAVNIMNKINELKPMLVELTGGAPEMNPCFTFFIENLFKQNIKTSVRTNLAILNDDKYIDLLELFKKYKVTVIGSLPWYTKEITDTQRGTSTFDKSIATLKRLNKIGYGRNGLELYLVYNPSGVNLPPQQQQIETEYKEKLKKYGIKFNKLITITNSPIGNFKKYLIKEGYYEYYLRLLKDNFNSSNIDKVMCKNLISIDYEGYIYDCDFNLSLGMKVREYENKKFWEIDFHNFEPLINYGTHCYACTANEGSSCNGSLINTNIHKNIKNYYGKELKGTIDLKTNACCSTESYPPYIKKIIPLIADEIIEKYYGCGSPIPPTIKGLKILDIGCGTGKDCYILSKLVGEKGFVYGIDMTEEQISIAKKYVNYHTKKFGFKKPNVKFIKDYIENIDKHFDNNSLDIIVSNCVVNLIEKKEEVLKKIYNILKEGGEFYFSDVYADRRVPNEIKQNQLLYGECLGGALYWRDFEILAKKIGFLDPRIVSKTTITINNDEIESLVEGITFYSITYRLWKIKELEEGCEDYGHIAIYKGGIKEFPFKFPLDNAHILEKDKPERVCGNTALILSKTRLKKYFKIIGTFKKHFGIFADCGKPDDAIDTTNNISCC